MQVLGCLLQQSTSMDAKATMNAVWTKVTQPKLIIPTLASWHKVHVKTLHPMTLPLFDITTVQPHHYCSSSHEDSAPYNITTVRGHHCLTSLLFNIITVQLRYCSSSQDKRKYTESCWVLSVLCSLSSQLTVNTQQCTNALVCPAWPSHLYS